MDKNEILTKISMTVLLVVGLPVLIFCMWRGVEISDLECVKKYDSCTIYARVAFGERHIKEFFKISDIIRYDVEKHKARGKHTYYDYYMPVLYMKGNDIVFIDFGSRTYENAALIPMRILDNEDYQIKGTYFKTFSNRY